MALKKTTKAPLIVETLKHIFDDDEHDENSVVRYFRTTAVDGKQYEVAHYNLGMVLALGFRMCRLQGKGRMPTLDKVAA